MDNLPPLKSKVQSSQNIPIIPFLRDHRFQTGPVLPAVHSMQILAAQTRMMMPNQDLHQMAEISFTKPLFLVDEVAEINAIFELERLTTDKVLSSLLTKVNTRSGIVRSLSHASLCFCQNINEPTENIEIIDWKPTARLHSLQAEEIYQRHILFGPQFQNLTGRLDLFQEGATSFVSGGPPVVGEYPLGSSFPLDAAFQAAYIYGHWQFQRACYPVAVQSRTIHRPTKAEERYLARALYRGQKESSLQFNLMIENEQGQLYETLTGVLMKELPLRF